MSVWSQINLFVQDPAKGVEPAVRISDRWGVPEEVIPTLQAVFKSRSQDPANIATAIVTRTETMEWSTTKRKFSDKDMDPNALNYHYAVDLTTTPWSVKVTECAGYPIVDNGDGTASPGELVPATSKTVKLKRKTAKAGN